MKKIENPNNIFIFITLISLLWSHAYSLKEAVRRYHRARNFRMRLEQPDHSLSKLKGRRDVLNIAANPHACPRSLWRPGRPIIYHSEGNGYLRVVTE